ncbi:DUF819 family protein [Leptospira langatensis]|uniref:DUF819 family protein n=1 Tax=Leptospira langatensis TaxID=2484983 RepID=A0A5F1ZN72_9LEPT|nr:DUF819 family protein [Leptospira langatensis]TGK05151.1 DUF819 family protein [Leptospira langatensis]TGL38288.1 DUF819 family protein [Leptospira langatensis]
MSDPISILISLAFVAFLFGFPAIAERLAKRFHWIGILGPVVLCYATGILLGNLLPEALFPRKILETISEVSVPIAIPLLLASSDFLKGLREAKPALFSFFLSCLAVSISSIVVGFALSSLHPESPKIQGMLAGLYTGGTPNLNAIGLALDTNRSTIALVNTADVVTGGIYLLFLLSFAKSVYSIFLKREEEVLSSQMENPLGPTSSGNTIIKASLGILLAVIGFALSLGLSLALTGALSAPFILLGISTWGIGISFSKKVRSLNTYPIGYYFILIFSIAIGFLADLKTLVAEAPNVFLILAATLSGSILLHLLFGIIFKIPVDTWIITSVSSLYGPAFVPSVAAAIGNRGVLVLGILTGLIGYALGNYLGLAVYWVLAR